MTGGTVALRDWRYWAGLTVVLLLAAQLFLVVLHVAERAAYPTSTDQRRSVDYVALGADGQPLPGGAVQQASVGDVAAAGYYGPPVDAPAARFSIPFTLADPDRPTAFYLWSRSDVRHVRLNGVEIAANVPLEQQQGDVSSEPAYFGLPRDALREGTNLLVIDKATIPGGAISLSSFAIGPADELSATYRVRRLLVVDTPMIGIAILMFTAALCMLANWPAADRGRMRALVGLLTVSAVTTAALTYAPQGQMPLWMTIGLYVLSNALIAIGILSYAGQDSRMLRLPDRYLIGSACAMLLLTALGLWWAQSSAESMGPRMGMMVRSSFYLVIAVGTAAIAMLAHAIVTQGWRLWAERLAFMLCIAFLLVDRIGTLFPLVSPFDRTLPVTLPWSPVVGVLLGIAVIASLARQASEARRTVVEANAILAARLADQDEELARNYAAQRELMERQAILEERQRIVRDMHDGIGGQLLGLLMQVRSGQVEPAVVERGLQTSLTDLRLIVDSMDSPEGGLADALHAFEHRARTLVEASGMQLGFEHGLGDRRISLSPRATLSILRILQEAVVNAVQHSGGTRIDVGSIWSGHGIMLTVADDGTGLPATRRNGRGLVNMAARAKDVGGELSWSSGQPKGTVLTLALPVSTD